jgi:hypothetical protein
VMKTAGSCWTTMSYSQRRTCSDQQQVSSSCVAMYDVLGLLLCVTLYQRERSCSYVKPVCMLGAVSCWCGVLL